MWRKTIATPVEVNGIGIHSGKPVRMILEPAGIGTGIRFVRDDLPGSPSVLAEAENIVSTFRATVLRDGPAVVSTVEHLLAVCYAFGVTDMVVRLDGEELPILDGSAYGFRKAIGGRLQGFGEWSAHRSIHGKVGVSVGESWAIAEPAEGMSLIVIFDDPAIDDPHQVFTWTGSLVCLLENHLLRARTRCFASSLHVLQDDGRCLGVTEANTLIYDEQGRGVRRMEGEEVLHKTMDLLGDLFYAGYVSAAITVYKPGHAVNVALAKRILEEAACG